jgi:hypothetical protein
MDLHKKKSIKTRIKFYPESCKKSNANEAGILNF